MKLFTVGLYFCVAILTACGGEEFNTETVSQVLEKPEFINTSVHDPSILIAEDTKYIIGSHLQFSRTNDLLQWETLSERVSTTDLFEDVYSELADEFEYAKTDTLWASDIIQLENGKYYLYYCLCEGTSSLSVLGVAVSDNIEGPYKKVDTFLQSGKGFTPDGQIYDASVHPNAIDPHVFLMHQVSYGWFMVLIPAGFLY